MTECDALGFHISQNGISVSKEKTLAIANAPPPKDVKGVRSFLAAASYYRTHIPRMAFYAEPLVQLTRKNAKFHWDAEKQTAFDNIKQALVSSEVLAFYEPENTTLQLHEDVSKVAIGSCLNQRYADGSVRPLGYFSRVLPNNESHWGSREREILAITFGIEKNKHYLWNMPFKIDTDNQALVYVKNMETPSARMLKLILKLSEYNYTIKWKKGSKNVMPDYLSRYPPNTETIAQVHAVTRSKAQEETGKMEPKRLKAEQKKDYKLNTLYEAIKKPKNTDAKTKKEAEAFYIEEGILWKKCYINSKVAVIPSHMKKEVLQSIHDDPFSGHSGIFKTIECARKRFYWKGMHADIRK